MKKINIGLFAAFLFVLVVVISSLTILIDNSYGDSTKKPKLEETAENGGAIVAFSENESVEEKQLEDISTTKNSDINEQSKVNKDDDGITKEDNTKSESGSTKNVTSEEKDGENEDSDKVSFSVIELNNAEKALQLLNHFSTVLYRVTDSKDLALLELEYDRIDRDNIFLDVIEDPETIAIIQQIMNYITKLRIDVKERELLHQWLREDLRSAVFSTCPNPTGLISANPKVIAIVTTQFAFSWFFHYMGERKRLLREFAKQNWELDKTNIDFLNQRNTELLAQTWTLVKRYKIRDAYRITIPEIKEFVKYVDGDDNENRVYEFLKIKEEKYKKFPEFWYRRGRAAEALGQSKDAMEAYRQYQKIYLQFLRKDQMAADVALNLAKLMIDDGKYEKEEMIKQLCIIENNVNDEDWTYLYFCGRTYLDLNDYENAYRVLAKAVTELSHSLSIQHDQFIENLKKEEKIEFLEKIPPSSYPLVICRSAYFEACSKKFSEYELGKKFSEMCEDKLVSGYEQILYCNENSKLMNNIPEALLNNLYRTVAYPDGRIYFHTPINWFYLGNEHMTINPQMKYKEKLYRSLPCLLKVCFITGEVEIVKEEIDERVFKYNKDKKTGEEHYLAKIEFPFKYKRIKNDKVKYLEFSFPLRGLDVSLRYLPKAEDIQLFPEQEKKYSPSVIIVNGIEIPATNENIATFEKIGESIKAYYKH